MGLSQKDNPHLELIWERDSVKEFTMKEIADKLGIPLGKFKIVGEK